MAWTTPETRTTGDKITNSIWNLQLVDNLQYLYNNYALNLIIIQDQKPSGTAGGTFTAGAWRTRDLNTEVYDPGGFASVAGNQITLVAGTYWVLTVAEGGVVNNHKTRLYDITNATTLLVGTSTSAQGAGSVWNPSFVIGAITLADTTVLELQHYAQTSRPTDGFGRPNSLGINEVYATVILIREGV